MSYVLLLSDYFLTVRLIKHFWHQHSEWDVCFLLHHIRRHIMSDYHIGGLVTKSGPALETPWTVACQAPLPMGFSRQEYWSGLPFPSPGDLPNPGIEPRSPALQADSLPAEL